MVSLAHSKPEAPFGTRTVAGSGLGHPGRGAGWLTLLPVVYGEGIVHANLRTVLSSCSRSSPPTSALSATPSTSLLNSVKKCSKRWQEDAVGRRDGPSRCGRKRQVPFPDLWEQLHCNAQAVRNLQSTVAVRCIVRLP